MPSAAGRCRASAVRAVTIYTPADAKRCGGACGQSRVPFAQSSSVGSVGSMFMLPSMLTPPPKRQRSLECGSPAAAFTSPPAGRPVDGARAKNHARSQMPQQAASTKAAAGCRSPRPSASGFSPDAEVAGAGLNCQHYSGSAWRGENPSNSVASHSDSRTVQICDG